VSAPTHSLDLIPRGRARRRSISGAEIPSPDGLSKAIGSKAIRKRVTVFWKTAVTVTTSDSSLNGTDAKYLEARLIELADQTDLLTLRNDRRPDPRNQGLPPDQAHAIEEFLDKLLIVLSGIGLGSLNKPSPPKPQPARDEPTKRKFSISFGREIWATGWERDGKYIVSRGSLARYRTGNVHSYVKQRNTMKREGVLIEVSEDRLRFAKDYEFKNRSAAASIVLDGQRNGKELIFS